MSEQSLWNALMTFWEGGPRGLFDSSLQSPPCAMHEEVRLLMDEGFVRATAQDTPSHSAGHLYLDSKGLTKGEARAEIKNLAARRCRRGGR